MISRLRIKRSWVRIPPGSPNRAATLHGWLFCLDKASSRIRTHDRREWANERSVSTVCCPRSGSDSSLLARNEHRARPKCGRRRLSERSEAESRRAHQRKAPPFTGNVIQIRMTEKRTGTENVPVSFFIKKNAQKG